jgi:hypothetical protein
MQFVVGVSDEWKKKMTFVKEVDTSTALDEQLMICWHPYLARAIKTSEQCFVEREASDTPMVHPVWSKSMHPLNTACCCPCYSPHQSPRYPRYRLFHGQLDQAIFLHPPEAVDAEH